MGKRAQNYRAWRYQNPNGTPEQAWNAAWDSHSANQYSRTMQRLGDELNAMIGIANTQKDIIGEQQAEISILDGSACKEEQESGNGPCGVCKNCLRAEIEWLHERLLREKENTCMMCNMVEREVCAEEKVSLKAEIERLREDAEAGNEWERQLLGCDKELTEAYAEIERLKKEVRVLRQYGNKDCISMADAALAATEPKE